MRRKVEIRGGGIAALCCARLLATRGLDIRYSTLSGTTGPTLLINGSTQKLMCDVFQSEPADLFAGSVIVQKRVVLWGGADKRVELPHFGMVVDESTLVRRLAQRTPFRSEESSTPDWVIYASAKAVTEQKFRFGSRVATLTSVQLANAGSDSCWMESLDEGWLFLVPVGIGTGSLISVGAGPERLLAGSRLVTQQITHINKIGNQVPSSPAILEHLSGSDWLACGGAGVRFDPICGEGAGHAVREAILASAVIRSGSGIGASASVLNHYESRVLGGFLRHLNLCKQFYESGGDGVWWRAEAKSLAVGAEWVTRRLMNVSTSRYRLAGFDLELANAV
jgi:hypothetical protein